jgi:hypothetical protein
MLLLDHVVGPWKESGALDSQLSLYSGRRQGGGECRQIMRLICSGSWF